MERVKTLLSTVDGNKTYFVAAATAAFALLGFFLGEFNFAKVVELLLAAGAMVGFRSAISKNQ